MSTWLHTIATTVSLNGLRKVRRIGARETAIEDAESLGSEVRRADPDLRDALRSAIDRLPEGYRTVFVMHDVAGYTHEEIGTALGIQAGTSKAQLFGARTTSRVAGPVCRSMDRMNDDEKFDNWLASVAKEYNRPPDRVPRAEMWDEIERGPRPLLCRATRTRCRCGADRRRRSAPSPPRSYWRWALDLDTGSVDVRLAGASASSNGKRSRRRRPSPPAPTTPRCKRTWRTPRRSRWPIAAPAIVKRIPRFVRGPAMC